MKVIHVFKSFLEQMRRGLFAADAAGAKYRYLLLLIAVEIVLHECVPFAEGGGVGIDGVFKRTELHFVIVARVNQQHFGIADELVPIFRWNVFARGVVGVHRRITERDNFGPDDDSQAVKCFAFRLTFAMRHSSKTRIAPDKFKQRCDSGLRSGEGGVEAFGGEDDRAVHLVRFAFGLEARLPIRGIGQLGEAIKCGDGLCQTLSISINGKVIEVRAVGTGGLKADVIYPGLKRGGCGEDFPVCPSSGVGEEQGLVDDLVVYLEL